MAEDIVQEAFLSLWRTGARYNRGRGSVRSWVLATVRNRAIDAFRRETTSAGRNVADDAALAQLVAAERTDSQAEHRAQAQRIRTALGQLPDEQRHVIELAYFGGFTHTEIAAMLDAPVGTVKGRMRLGLKKLHAELAGGRIDL
jgi:RNA polymerase sigma-70 factor (ECF subfamily)